MSLSDKFLVAATKIGSQRHMVAIRDAFATLMPILIAGSIALILNNFPVQFFHIALENGETAVSLRQLLPPAFSVFNGNVWWGTFGMFALLLCPLLAYNLAKSYGNDKPLPAAVVALSAFLAIVPQGLPAEVPEIVVAGGESLAVPAEIVGATFGTWGSLHFGFLNAQGLFVAMIVAIISTEVFVRLSKIRQLEIKMPDGVPPAVMRSFSALVPGVAAVFSIVLLAMVTESIAHVDVFTLIMRSIGDPLKGLTNTLPAALIVAFLIHFLWFFGLHGPNILEGAIQTIFMPNIDANIAAYQAGAEIPFIVTKPFFDTFVYMGGSGTTLALLIAILFLSKSKAMRTMSKVSIGPGIFNINEPVIFGFPIVLNLLMGIPFVITPMVLTAVSYTAMSLGLVAKTVAITHWTIPPILSGYLATGGSISGVILQIVNLAVAVLIYVPFVIMADKQEIAKENAQKKKAAK